MSIKDTMVDIVDKRERYWNEAWIRDFVANAELYIGTLILLFYGALTLLNVVLGFTIKRQLNWGQSVVLGLFIWTVWLATAHTVKTGNHLRFTGVVQNLSLKFMYAVLWIEWLLWILFGGVLFLFSIEVTKNYYAAGAMVPGTAIPKWLFYLSIPVGMVLILVRTIEQMYVVTKAYRRDRDISEYIDLEA